VLVYLIATLFLEFVETSTETLPSENKTGIVAGSVVGAVVVIFIISVIAVVCSRLDEPLIPAWQLLLLFLIAWLHIDGCF